MRRWLLRLLVVLPVLVIAGLFAVPPLVDRALNRVLDVPHAPLSEAGRALHAKLQVADMHADPLLWKRDLTERIDHGHVDIPRLIEGNVALQVFSAPTQVPLGLNYDANELRQDMVTSLAIFQGWPRDTWHSPLQRALYMSAELHRAAERSQGAFRVIEDAPGLARYLTDRRSNPRLTAGMLSIEGMHAIEGNLDNIEVLRRAGFRMMGLAHFFDNALTGSAHGMEKGGLTDLGRQAIARMESSGILVDLAHTSPRAIDDALKVATRPLVVSHVGLKGTCDTIRNLSDDQARAIAKTGGVIGIGYWDAAVCDVSVRGVARAIQYGIELVGADAIGLGSDFDGATHTPFDTAGLALITDELLRMGVSESDIRKVMGGNVIRVLAGQL